MVLMFLIAFASNAQSVARGFKKGSVNLEYKPSPLFYTFNHQNTNKTESAGWLLVKVKYHTPSQKRGGNVIWIDDVDLEVEVVLPASYKGKNVNVLLKGTIPIWSIPMDGKVHEEWGCIPPQVIHRFARKGYKIDKQKILARATFFTAGRKILLRDFSTSNSRARKYFTKLTGSISSGVLTVNNIILPRTKTPWMAVNYERFELINPNSKK